MAINQVSGIQDMVKVNFDQALEKFMDVFLEFHPKNSWPTWFKSCTTYGGEKDLEGNWRFAFTAISRDVLEEGESWEELPNGNFALTKVDMETGEKRYVISNTSKEIITLFEVSIDPVSSEVSVIFDRNLAEVDGSELLPYRK